MKKKICGYHKTITMANGSMKTPTKYLNSKGRRIFLSAKGTPFIDTNKGRRYSPVAKSLTNNNGSQRLLNVNSARNVPNSIRPKRARSGKKDTAVARKPRAAKSFNSGAMMAKIMNKTYKAPKAKASGRPAVARKPRAAKSFNAGAMMAKIMNKTYKAPKAKASGRPAAARKPRSNAGVARKSADNKAATKAASKRFAAAKRAAARVGVARKIRANKGVARGPQAGREQRRMNAAAKKMAAKRAAGPVARKPRSNKGGSRKLVTSPGGSVYKGLAALSQALASRARANNLAKLVKKPRRSARLSSKK